MGANQTRVLRGEPDPKTMPASPVGEQFEERVMVATQEQMNLAQLPLKQRDYCAHFLIKYMKCKRDMWPNLFCCKHERHEWEYCQQEEGVYYVQRMKQYERERRLLERQQRREQTTAA